MSDKKTEFPQGDEESLTKMVHEDMESEVPPDSTGSDSVIQQFNSLPMAVRVGGVLAVLFVIGVMAKFMLFPSSGEINNVQVNQLSNEDKLRAETDKFGANEAKEELIEDNSSALEDEELINPNSPVAEGNVPGDLQNIKPTNMEGPPVSQHSNSGGFSGGSGTNYQPQASVGYTPSATLQRRMSEGYAQVLDFHKSPQVVYTSGEENSGGATTVDLTKTVDPQYQNLYDNAGEMRSGRTFYMPAASEIKAVLDENIDSDYPSVFRATIISPHELHGSKALIAYSLGNERISAQVQKIVIPGKPGAKSTEITVQAVVRDGLPGIGGDVNRHYGKMAASGLAGAGLTGAALWYAQQNSNPTDLTNALVVAPMVQEGTQALMKPVNHYGRERPPTIKANAGQEISIIITTGFEVTL